MKKEREKIVCMWHTSAILVFGTRSAYSMKNIEGAALGVIPNATLDGVFCTFDSANCQSRN